MKTRLSLLVFLAASLPCLASAQGNAFYQGPGELGRVESVAGTVIGVHPGMSEDCYLILADRSSTPPGLGGAGRFFLCDKNVDLRMNQHWGGRVVQIDRRLARIGPKWRPVSVFEIAPKEQE